MDLEVTDKVGLGTYSLIFLMVTKTMPWIPLKMASNNVPLFETALEV